MYFLNYVWILANLIQENNEKGQVIGLKFVWFDIRSSIRSFLPLSFGSLFMFVLLDSWIL